MNEIREENAIVREKFRNNLAMWICEYWRISSGENRGQKYSFKTFPFLQGYIEDNYYHKVFMKCSQTGVSELIIAGMFARADLFAGNALYVFPARKQLGAFVQSRVIDPINSSEYISGITRDQKSIDLIKVGGNFIYFRGSQSENDIVSVDASHLILDERDKMKESTVDTLYRRTEGQRSSIIEEVGNPTFPGFGIDESYYGSDNKEGTDQRRYVLKCYHCDKHQALEWWDEDKNPINFINLGNDKKPRIVCICRYCKKGLDRLQVGKWEPMERGNEIHGYTISKLYHPYAVLERYYKRSISQKTMELQNFYNHDLGISNNPTGSNLIDEHILAARGTHLMSRTSQMRTICGIDVGIPHYYFIGTTDKKIIATGTLNSSEEIEILIRKFNVQCLVIDGEPEIEMVVKLKTRYRNIIYSADFPPRGFDNDPETLYKLDIQKRKLLINRTRAMTVVQDEVSSGLINFPLDIADVEGFIDHMKAPKRAKLENEDGEIKYVFIKNNKPDHYFFAVLFYLVGVEINPRRVIIASSGIYSGNNNTGKQVEFGRKIG